jgi:hypothetical protein
MDTLGINATQEEIDVMIQEIDEDSNGEIDFDGTVLFHFYSMLLLQAFPRHYKASGQRVAG